MSATGVACVNNNNRNFIGVGFLELLFFNIKMKRIHGNSYTEWNPELEYREKFLS